MTPEGAWRGGGGQARYARSALARLVLRFHQRPLEGFRCGRFKRLFPEEAAARLAVFPRGRLVLTSLARQRLGGGGFLWVPATPVHRLALAPGSALERLFLYAGAGCLAGAASRTIARRRVAALREALGEEGYRFMMTTAPLLAPPPLSGRCGEGAAGGGEALRLGCAVAGCAWRGLRASVWRRVRLKLPEGFDPWFESSRAADYGERESGAYLVRVALQVFPSWSWLSV